MKKILYQFLIIFFAYWLTSPLVELFIDGASIDSIDKYYEIELIERSLVFGIIFTIVFNIVYKYR